MELLKVACAALIGLVLIIGTLVVAESQDDSSAAYIAIVVLLMVLSAPFIYN